MAINAAAKIQTLARLVWMKHAGQRHTLHPHQACFMGTFQAHISRLCAMDSAIDEPFQAALPLASFGQGGPHTALAAPLEAMDEDSLTWGNAKGKT